MEKAKDTVGLELFRLVKTMSPGEKRYFRNFRIQDGNPQHMYLYDLIDKQKVFDEQKLKTQVQNYGQTKLNLLEAVLKSLRNTRANENIETRLHNAILEINLLHRRGCNFIALKKLDDTIETAKEYGFYLEQQQLLSLKMQVSIVLGRSNEMHKNAAYFKEEQQSINKAIAGIFESLFTVSEYNATFAVKGSLARSEEDKQFLNNFNRKQNLINPESGIAPEAILRNYLIASALQYSLNNSKSALQVSQRVLAYLDDNKLKTERFVNLRFMLLYNAILENTLCFNHTFAWELIGRLEKLVREAGHLEQKVAFYLAIAQYDWHMQTSKPYEAEPYADALHILVERFPHMFTTRERQIAYTTVAGCKLMLENYIEAEKMFSKIINKPDYELVKIDNSISNYLEYCLVLLELNDKKALKVWAVKAKNFLRRIKDKAPIEKLLTDFFLAWSSSIKNEEERRLLDTYFKKIEEEYNKGLSITIITRNFDYIAWFKSKITNQPLTPMLIESHKKRHNIQ